MADSHDNLPPNPVSKSPSPHPDSDDAIDTALAAATSRAAGEARRGRPLKRQWDSEMERSLEAALGGSTRKARGGVAPPPRSDRGRTPGRNGARRTPGPAPARSSAFAAKESSSTWG